MMPHRASRLAVLGALAAFSSCSKADEPLGPPSPECVLQGLGDSVPLTLATSEGSVRCTVDAARSQQRLPRATESVANARRKKKLGGAFWASPRR